MITKRAVLFLTILLLIGCSEKKQKATPALKSSLSEIVNLKEYLIPYEDILDNPQVEVWKDSNGDISYYLIEVSDYGEEGFLIIYTKMNSNLEQIQVWEDHILDYGFKPLDSRSRKCIECEVFGFDQTIGKRTRQNFYDQNNQEVTVLREFIGIENNQAIFDISIIVNSEKHISRHYFSKGIGY